MAVTSKQPNHVNAYRPEMVNKDSFSSISNHPNGSQAQKTGVSYTTRI